MSVDSIVSFVAGKIGDLLVEEAKFLYDVKNKVKSLESDLRWMSSFLIDHDDVASRFDDNEDKVSERLRTAIEEIRSIAYDAEDAVDSYIVDVHRSKLKKYSRFCSCLVQTHQVGTQIDDVRARIRETTDNWKRYQVQFGDNRDKGIFEGGSSSTKPRRQPTYPFNADEYGVGLEEDIKKMVEKLTAPDNKHISLLCINGMGGSGKTTLARKLYNHATIKQYFNFLAWVCVSQEWETKSILLEILRKTGKEKPEGCTQENLVEELGSILSNNKYLLILDDVWSKKALEDILRAIPVKNTGSKILITTRNREVVSFPDLDCYFHEPQRLDKEQSLELFKKIAFSHRQEIDDFNKFEKLSEEMLGKCDGLPLAIIALAGLLRTKDEVKDWEKVKNNVSSRVMEGGRGTHLYGAVRDMLTLSYNDLPHFLKPCFLHLGLFPEDSEIPVGRLIRMWVAEGFVTNQQKQGYQQKTLEDVAKERLDELIQRCMVHVVERKYNGDVKTIKIHDLLRDLCIRLGEKHGFLDIFPIKSSSDKISIQSRRASIQCYVSSEHDIAVHADKNSHVRSLYIFGLGWRNECIITWKSFRLVRVLKLVSISTSDDRLSPEIGSLVHLRYLEIRRTNIGELPATIGNLRNLLTLDYRDVCVISSSMKLPNVLCNLRQLRHLYLPVEVLINVNVPEGRLSLQLGNLKSLKTLVATMIDIKDLSPGVEKLHVHKVKRSQDVETILDCPSIKSGGGGRLRKLVLYGDRLQCPLIPSIQPLLNCTNLQDLQLNYFTLGEKIDEFPSTLMKVRLADTQFKEQETILRALGRLPQLKHLDMAEAYDGMMEDHQSIRHHWIEWTCKTREFPRLEYLWLYGLRSLREWTMERGTMPCLKKLIICGCGKLERIPEGLRFITSLQELCISRMSRTFRTRLEPRKQGFEFGGEDVHIIHHIPTVTRYTNY